MTAPAEPPKFSPLYKQIKLLILRSLEQGEWKPGDLIPSEVELAGRFGVSQGTVRKAVDELSSEHILFRRQGKGTFVATHQEQHAQLRFLRLVSDDVHTAREHPLSTILGFEETTAPAEIASHLDQKLESRFLRILRSLRFSGGVLVMDEIWLPLEHFEGLTEATLRSYAGPMYGLFEQAFGIKML